MEIRRSCLAIPLFARSRSDLILEEFEEVDWIFLWKCNGEDRTPVTAS